MHRSIGVTILALFVGIIGALGVWQALGLPAGIRVTTPILDLMGLPIRLVFCASCVVFAYGAWRLKPWAWTLSVVITVLTVPLVGLSAGALPACLAAASGLVDIYIVGHVLGASGRGDAWPRIGKWL
jgi:hypothetical protein